MLRELRKKNLDRKKSLELDNFLEKKSRKLYIERNYKEIKLYRYLLFLRKNGADLNSFFDDEISCSKL